MGEARRAKPLRLLPVILVWLNFCLKMARMATRAAQLSDSDFRQRVTASRGHQQCENEGASRIWRRVAPKTKFNCSGAPFFQFWAVPVPNMAVSGRLFLAPITH